MEILGENSLREEIEGASGSEGGRRGAPVRGRDGGETGADEGDGPGEGFKAGSDLSVSLGSESERRARPNWKRASISSGKERMMRGGRRRSTVLVGDEKRRSRLPLGVVRGEGAD